jgi:hypothetical protein
LRWGSGGAGGADMGCGTARNDPLVDAETLLGEETANAEADHSSPAAWLRNQTASMARKMGNSVVSSGGGTTRCEPVE